MPPRELWPRLAAGGARRGNAAVEILDRARRASSGPSPVCARPDATWSYRDLRDRADRIASVLVEDYGLVPGNRVLLRGANSLMLAACWFGVLKGGRRRGDDHAFAARARAE